MKKRKRLLSLLLAALLLGGTPRPALGTDARGDEVRRRIDAYYAAVQTVGTPCWNARKGEADLKSAADAGQYAKSVTGRPCSAGGCRSNRFAGGTQCYGFAKYMCYVVFGSYPKYARTSSVSGAGGSRNDGWTYCKASWGAYPGLQAGDMIRWYVPGGSLHAAMVYSVDGDSVTLFDCNNYLVGNTGCRIAKSPLKNSVFRRYYERGQAYICRNTAGVSRVTLSFSTGVSASIPSLTETGPGQERRFQLPRTLLSREGCVFLGWSLSPGGEARWKPGDSVSFSADTTLYAVWRVKDPLTGSCFLDVSPGDWYENDVRFVTENRLMSGFGGGRFRPEAPLTRAQLAQILYNREGCPGASGPSPFPDVTEGAWYEKAVSWSHESGIFRGYTSGDFGPDDPVSREQLAAVLYRYAGSQGDSQTGSLSAFSDGGSVSPYAAPALKWAVRTGVVSGKGGGVLDPAGPAARAEAASMLRRFSAIPSLQTGTVGV